MTDRQYYMSPDGIRMLEDVRQEKEEVPPRRRISVHGGELSVLAEMADGNIGALSVLSQMREADKFAMIKWLDLEDMNIRGSQIWVAYKDHCGENMEEFIKCINRRSPEMVATVNKEFYEHNEIAVTHGASFKHK